MIDLCLPWPPSTNRYWRSLQVGRGVRVVISRQGREYSESVSRIVASKKIRSIEGSLFARYDLYPPDRRRRDLDNYDSKALNDALTKSGLIVDDSQIRGKISWYHDEIFPHGRVVVQLVPLGLVEDVYKQLDIL